MGRIVPNNLAINNGSIVEVAVAVDLVNIIPQDVRDFTGDPQDFFRYAS